MTDTNDEISAMASDPQLSCIGPDFLIRTAKYNYTYQFTWLGRPIIQVPQDIIALQEIIWRARPEVVLETGIAHGGSLVFYASMLELIGGDGFVVGIDIDIRAHNRVQIEEHPMFQRIRMIQGSSVDAAVAQQVHRMCEGPRVLVVVDSNHTHDHGLQELNLYSPLVKQGELSSGL